jgi:hypothetical protein
LAAEKEPRIGCCAKEPRLATAKGPTLTAGTEPRTGCWDGTENWLLQRMEPRLDWLLRRMEPRIECCEGTEIKLAAAMECPNLSRLAAAMEGWLLRWNAGQVRWCTVSDGCDGMSGAFEVGGCDGRFAAAMKCLRGWQIRWRTVSNEEAYCIRRLRLRWNVRGGKPLANPMAYCIRRLIWNVGGGGRRISAWQIRRYEEDADGCWLGMSEEEAEGSVRRGKRRFGRGDHGVTRKTPMAAHLECPSGTPKDQADEEGEGLDKGDNGIPRKTPMAARTFGRG